MKGGSGFLQDRLALFGTEWKEHSARFWSSPDLPFFYPEMLKISYQVIRASASLLELARDQALRLASEDPVAAGLAPYLSQHVEEERGHDEWLLGDLAALGITSAEAQGDLPSPHVAGMVGAQHYWILHTHPVAILGYLAVLEGEPPSEAFFVQAAERTGLPEGAFQTLRYHSRVDQAHWRDLLDLFDALPMEPRHLSLTGLSMLHTCRGMGSAIQGVMSKGAGSRASV